MATAAVLRSENCLNGRYHLDAFRSRPPPPPKSHRKKPKSPNRKPTVKKPLVMENIKILKRGEDPNALAADSERIGPDPEILGKELGLMVLDSEFAGPAFFVSPEPSALPMPGFLARNDDVATKSLRFVLGLN